MTRFFFDIRDQEGTTFDQEGVELPDLDAALKEARQALADIMREDITGTGKGAVCIEIRSGEGRALVEVVATADERTLATEDGTAPSGDPPTVRQIEPGYAIWTFSTADRGEQERQFRRWCGWFGYGEDDKPERVDGKRWWIRSSLKQFSPMCSAPQPLQPGAPCTLAPT